MCEKMQEKSAIRILSEVSKRSDGKVLSRELNATLQNMANNEKRFSVNREGIL